MVVIINNFIVVKINLMIWEVNNDSKNNTKGPGSQAPTFSIIEIICQIISIMINNSITGKINLLRFSVEIILLW